MKIPVACATAALLATGLLASPAAPARDTLAPFRSEAQFRAWVADWKARAAREDRRRRGAAVPVATSVVPPPSPPMPAPAPATPATASHAAPSLDAMSVTGTRVAEESITNVQTQGVDEGGIVKRQGEHLVVLRRGRLFTLRIGGDRLEPVASVDAFGPGIDPRGAWYDEMLVSDGTVVVLGYSYARGGTEIGLFDLDARGGAAPPRHLAPARQRLLLLAQLREPAGRRQARRVHARRARHLR